MSLPLAEAVGVEGREHGVWSVAVFFCQLQDPLFHIWTDARMVAKGQLDGGVGNTGEPGKTLLCCALNDGHGGGGLGRLTGV